MVAPLGFGVGTGRHDGATAPSGHSSFWIGIYGLMWVAGMELLADLVEQLLYLIPNKVMNAKSELSWWQTQNLANTLVFKYTEKHPSDIEFEVLE